MLRPGLREPLPYSSQHPPNLFCLWCQIEGSSRGVLGNRPQSHWRKNVRVMAGLLLWLPRSGEQRKTDWPSSRLPGEGGDKRAPPEGSLSMHAESISRNGPSLETLARDPHLGGFWRKAPQLPSQFPPWRRCCRDLSGLTMQASLLDLSHHCERRLEDGES